MSRRKFINHDNLTTKSLAVFFLSHLADDDSEVFDDHNCSEVFLIPACVLCLRVKTFCRFQETRVCLLLREHDTNEDQGLLQWHYNFRFENILQVRASVLGRFPFIRTDRPNRSSCKENFTI